MKRAKPNGVWREFQRTASWRTAEPDAIYPDATPSPQSPRIPGVRNRMCSPAPESQSNLPENSQSARRIRYMNNGTHPEQSAWTCWSHSRAGCCAGRAAGRPSWADEWISAQRKTETLNTDRADGSAGTLSYKNHVKLIKVNDARNNKLVYVSHRFHVIII